jgi:CHAT domain-containing protein/tetratricopeptide (TPR) repeat protein
MGLLTVLLGLAPESAALTCLPLTSGQAVKALAGSGRPACFTVVVTGEPAELIAEQPADFEIRLKENNTMTLVDSFNFGPEAATIDLPGEYQVEIEPVAANRAPVEFLMSRRPVSLQEAALRRAAEATATAAKRSRKPEDMEAALDLWMKAGDWSAAGRTHLRLGSAAVTAASLPSARDSFERALALCQSVAFTRCTAEAANNAGWVAQQLGDFDQALSRLTEAAAEWQDISELKLAGLTFSNLGLLFWQTGDYQQAIAYYDRAGAILAPRDTVANGRVLNNLGLSYQSLAEYEQAGNYFERALAALSPSAKDAVRARLNLGRNYMLEGRQPLARKALQRALSEATEIGDRAAQADTLCNLGQSLLAAGSAADAQATLQKALTLHRTLGDKRMEAIDLHHLGLAASTLGDSASARDLLNQAFEIRRACGLRDAATDSLFALAGLERDAGHADAARELAGRALTIMESVRSEVPGAALRASFYARKRRFFDLLVDLEMTSGNSHAAEDGLLAAESGRGRALTDLLAEGQLLQQPPGELLRKRSKVQRQIDLLAVRLTSAPADRSGELRQQVENLVSQDEEIEADIRQSGLVEKLGRPLGSVADLQERYLPPESAVLEYHLAEEQSYLWLVERDGIQVFRLPARATIESQCEPVLALFSAILDRKRSPATEARFEGALRQLSATLIGPLYNLRLPSRVIVVPDGVLTRIPFAALEIPGNRRLGLVHDLLQVPSAAYLEIGRRPRSVREFPKAFLAVADPVYSPKDPRVAAKIAAAPGDSTADLARLPYSGELDTVSALVPAARRRILRGFDADAGMVKASQPRDFAILHFSAHALIDDRTPELSRIALSMAKPSGTPVDGFLRPYQLSQLPLDGSTVVLSACDSALGKQVIGEGLVGFTTSLFAAGAAQLVLTLSPVDAEGSAEFLSQTYRHVFDPRPAAMEHAITLARRGMAQSERWRDPYYWASFVVYGRPAEAVGPR